MAGQGQPPRDRQGAIGHAPSGARRVPRPPRRWPVSRRKVVATLAGLGVFAAGAIASPALADLYEWARDLVLGRTVDETVARQLNVVGYDGTLREGYEVERTVTGACNPGSASLAYNPNAYRCTYEEYVADPCLAMQGGASVVCLTGPWDRKLTQVNVHPAVSFDPSFVASGQETPWALEIKDPRHPRQTWRCLTLTGATTPIAGNQPNWWCTRADGTGEGRALNDLITGEGPVWKVLFSDADEPELVEADVAVAWY
jgi:hypothetical protein